MRKIIGMVAVLFMTVQMTAQAAESAQEKAMKKPMKAVATKKQKGKALANKTRKGPATVTQRDKLSTSGHRNDREGTEDADRPRPDAMRGKMSNKAAHRLNDTPRNPVKY